VANLTVQADASGKQSAQVPLLPGNHTLGRSSECDLRLGVGVGGVSRRHAGLRWAGDHFELTDLNSSHGTRVNGLTLRAGEATALQSGDVVDLGGLKLVYQALAAGVQPTPSGPLCQPTVARGLTSLDPAEVIARGLELLRQVSGVERSLLIGVGVDARLDRLLVPLSDPRLQVSRSSIARAVETGKTVVRIASAADTKLTDSMVSFNLRHIWVHPVTDPDGKPLAAVYLDSVRADQSFAPATEAELVEVAEQIGSALRNALLHAEVLDLNRTLERRVTARTRELEQSRAQLVAQDRLVTLGRLVAAIAHELNNPVGAIASFAGTLRGLAAPLLQTRTELAAAVPDPRERDRAQALLDLALAAARRPPMDTRSRREREASMAAWLTRASVTAADLVAQRLARIGITPAEVEPSLAVLQARGEVVSALAERLYTFGRSLEIIGQCSADLARIVSGLKTYSHLDRATVEVADVHRGIQAALAVLAPLIPHTIQVVTRFAEIEPFEQRPGELAQVWANLVDNATRAMGEKGTLSIETTDLGDHVRVTVTDTGPGVPPGLQDHIFDLHVTTRGPGAGLGLGLPICRTIVEQNHGGSIAFQSRPGHTSFTVTLPKRTPRGPE
jgi:signal transduction histidine kinase